MSKLQQLIQDLCPNGVEWKTLGEMGKVLRGKRLTKNQLLDSEKYPVYHGGIEPLGYYGQCNRKANTVMIINVGASAGSVAFSNVDFWSSDGCFCIEQSKFINDKFLFHYLLGQQDFLRSKVRKAGIPTLDNSIVEKLEIPVPPLPIQNEIVRILDTFSTLTAELQAELQARKSQYEYYRNQLLDQNKGKVEWKTLGEIAENLDFMRKPVTSGSREKGNIPYYGASGIVDYVKNFIFDGDFLLISEDGANLFARNTPIAFSISGKSWVNNHAHILKFETYAERRFVEYYLNSKDLTPYISGAAQPKLNQKNLNSIQIPIPPLSEQKRIVSILDKFDTLVNSITEGLPKEIELRQKQYEYYRDLLLTFPQKNA